VANIVWRRAAERIEGGLHRLVDRVAGHRTDVWRDLPDGAGTGALAHVAKVTVVARGSMTDVEAIPSAAVPHLVAHVDELVVRVRRPQGPLDERAVRRLRTALRRQRALVRATASVGPSDTDLDRALRRLGKRLGTVRDLDVALAGLATRRAAAGSDLERAALDELEQRLAKRRIAALRRATSRLDEADIAAAADMLRGHVAEILGRGQIDVLAQQWWNLAHAELLAALDHADGDEHELEALHRIRIAARVVRYGLESFDAVAPADARAWLDDVLTLQRAIGKHRDAALLHEGLRERAERASKRGHIALARGLEASVIAARIDRDAAFTAVHAAVARARAGVRPGPAQLLGSDVARSPTRSPPGRSGLA
jgi:CHAD domain-containing protein